MRSSSIKYIAYIEEHAKEEGYEDLGLKICLGAYKKKRDDKGPKTTVFLVPTAKNCMNHEKNKQFKNKDVGNETNDEESDNIYTARAMNLTGSGGSQTY